MLTKDKALEIIDDLEDFSLMADINPHGQITALQRYVDEVESIKESVVEFVESLVQHNISQAKPDIVFTNEINSKFVQLIKIWAESK